MSKISQNPMSSIVVQLPIDMRTLFESAKSTRPVGQGVIEAINGIQSFDC